MAYNGSGLFVRIYNWVTDKANGIKIRADRMDAEMDGFATGLSTAITKDGQTTITANLPMAGFKHTGVGAASTRTDYLRASQVQDNDLTTFTATGTDTYAITPIPAVTSYTSGQAWQVLFTNGNTGASTIAVSGLPAKAITKRGAVALVAGDIPAVALALIVYDGTQFQLQSIGVEPDYFVASGTDTYTVTASPALTAYTAGRAYTVYFPNANTGPATINFNGLGAKDLTKLGAAALGSGDLAAGYVTQIVYDGTRFQTAAPGASVSLGLAAGAAQTGSFTAAINTKYVCNFTATATITLPSSASAGDVIVLAIGGYQSVTLDPNGLKINASTSSLSIGSDMQTLMITYTGTTNGWA